MPVGVRRYREPERCCGGQRRPQPNRSERRQRRRAEQRPPGNREINLLNYTRMPYTICTMRSAAALLLLVISTNPAPAQLARPPYAITNAKVVTAPGKTIENAT